ncbi:MAG: hypothetical protein P8181_07575, partial [bacterium]
SCMPAKRILFPFAFLVAGFLLAVPCSARGIVIEGEDFVAYHDVGGVGIASILLSGCSGGHALSGLDQVGEWVEYNVPVSEFGRYTFLMKCRGDFGVPYTLRMVFTPAEEGTEQTVDFAFVGMGYG